MQRRTNKTSPTKTNSNGDRKSSLPTRYDAKSHRNNDNTSLVCKILAGSIITLSALLWIHHVHIHVHPEVPNADHLPPPKKVNGHWEEWVVDDDGAAHNTHHVLDGEVLDDPTEFSRQEKVPADTIDMDKGEDSETIQGKYFTIYKPRRTTEEATQAMLDVSNENVLGEKKLKKELKNVKDRQKRHQDLGVDVLSRWMGDGVPVIVGPGATEQTDTNTETKEKVETVKNLKAADEVETKSTFPSPADLLEGDAEVALEPAFGEHRPDQNAVFAFAEGYNLDIYAGFIDSLIDTGFTGDIILSVSSLEKLDPEVEKYLRSRPNLVVYAVKWDCFKKSGEEIDVSFEMLLA